MWPFKCKHPAGGLVVEKDHTDRIADEDFRHITYHLMCRNCGEKIDIGYAKMRGGLKGMRGRARYRAMISEISRPVS